MIHTKKYVSIALSLCLALSLCPSAFAAGAQTYSQQGLEFIESREGYEQYQYEDPKGSGNYYIGFGTKCEMDQYPDGVTRAEAEQLMRDYLDTTAVPELNAYLNTNGITLSQSQFDALTSFTYNLGSSWMNSGWRIDTYLKNGIGKYTDVQIVDAMGVLSHQNGTAIDGLVNRRIREAQIFLYGDYTGANCTQYSWLIVNKNGGTVENDVFCYEKGKAYGTLPQPTLEGMYFAGWTNNATGAALKATDTVSGNVHATAVWSDTFVLPYTDVKDSDWYYSAVTNCYKTGLMLGVTDTSFAPAVKMSRAMMVTVLWRMAGSPAVGGAMPFTDVAAGTWYTDAVRWAYLNGIAAGTTSATFSPSANVTREQMVTFMYNFAKLQGTVSDEGAAMGLAGYVDAGSISGYATDAFRWAVNTGVVQGSQTSNGMALSPKDTASRAEVAQVISNYSGR